MQSGRFATPQGEQWTTNSHKATENSLIVKRTKKWWQAKGLCRNHNINRGPPNNLAMTRYDCFLLGAIYESRVIISCLVESHELGVGVHTCIGPEFIQAKTDGLYETCDIENRLSLEPKTTLVRTAAFVIRNLFAS